VPSVLDIKSERVMSFVYSVEERHTLNERRADNEQVTSIIMDIFKGPCRETKMENLIPLSKWILKTRTGPPDSYIL